MKEISYQSLIKVYEDDIQEEIDQIKISRNNILELQKEVEILKKELQNKQADDTGITEPKEGNRDVLLSGKCIISAEKNVRKL